MGKFTIETDKNIDCLEETLLVERNAKSVHINSFVFLKKNIYVDRYVVLSELNTSRFPLRRGIYCTSYEISRR